MTTITSKSARDAVLAGGPTSAALVILLHIGLGIEEAALLAPLAALVAMGGYRSLRARWPWLADMDAPSGS